MLTKVAEHQSENIIKSEIKQATEKEINEIKIREKQATTTATRTTIGKGTFWQST